MKTDMNKLLTLALAPDETADTEINREILREFRKADTMKHPTTYKKQKVLKLAACICTFVLLGSITTFAAIKYFSPSDVATEFQDKSLAKAFEGDTAVIINETQSFKDYNVTFLGTVSGEDLSDFVADSSAVSFDLAKGRTYAIVAIEKSDGSPMPDTSDTNYGTVPFFVSPYIKGENPNLVNAVTMNGNYCDTVNNGIMYRIAECDNVEVFADREVYLGVSSSLFYEPDIYTWNEKDGTLTPNPDYDGVNALFTLPLDKGKADPSAAEIYLNAVLNGDENEEASSENENGDALKDLDVSNISLEDLDSGYDLLEDSVINTKADSNGMINYSYEENGTRTEGGVAESELFPDHKTGLSDIFDVWGESPHLFVTTFELMEDGTVTIRTYQKK